MDAFIPSTLAVRAELQALSHAQVQELSKLSGVPFTTLWKVRAGETRNPGLDTVRMFWPHMPRAKAPPRVTA